MHSIQLTYGYGYGAWHRSQDLGRALKIFKALCCENIEHSGSNYFHIAVQAIRSLLDRVASADVTMHEIEGGAHELFIGLEREKVAEYILQWVDKQLAADNQSEASEKMTKSRSMVSVTGNPFEWRPTGMSPAGSIYGSLLSLLSLSPQRPGRCFDCFICNKSLSRSGSDTVPSSFFHVLYLDQDILYVMSTYLTASSPWMKITDGNCRGLAKGRKPCGKP